MLPKLKIFSIDCLNFSILIHSPAFAICCSSLEQIDLIQPEKLKYLELKNANLQLFEILFLNKELLKFKNLKLLI